MKTPRLLLGASLLFWGWCSGLWVVAIPLALLVEFLQRPRASPWLALDDSDCRHIVDLCAVLTALAIAYFLATQGVPRGLLSVAGWLPLTLAPLALAQLGGRRRFRIRHLFYSMRRSVRADADQEVDVLLPWFGLLLLAAGIMAPRSAVFFALLTLLVGYGLFGLTRGVVSRLAFVASFAVASSSGFILGEGVHRLHGLLEEWVVPFLTDGIVDPFKAQTRIGDLGRLKLSDRIVWRVESDSPLASSLHLRDGVYVLFDGQGWLARAGAFQRLSESGGRALLAGESEPRSPFSRLRLTGSSSGGRAVIPLPLGAVALDNLPGLASINSAGVVKLDEAPSLLRIDVVARTEDARAESSETSDLHLSRRHGELFERLGAAAPEVSRERLAQLPAPQRLAAVQAFFAQHFRYTLFLGDETSGRKDIERFLLKDRSGHCEYFATATVLLLRYLDVPARYVTGYSAHEYSTLERAYVVRKRHAHAWVEAYVDGRWTTVDTTPSTWVGVEEDQSSSWQGLLDFASWCWSAMLLWQADGMPIPAPFAWGLGALLLAYLGRAVWRRRSRRAVVALADVPLCVDAYAEFEVHLTRLGFPRSPGETPRSWLERLHREGCPALGDARFSSAEDWLAEGYRQRYAGAGSPG